MSSTLMKVDGIRWWLLTAVATVASGPTDRIIDLAGGEGKLLLKWSDVQSNFGWESKTRFWNSKANDLLLTIKFHKKQDG